MLSCPQLTTYSPTRSLQLLMPYRSPLPSTPWQSTTGPRGVQAGPEGPSGARPGASVLGLEASPTTALEASEEAEVESQEAEAEVALPGVVLLPEARSFKSLLKHED